MKMRATRCWQQVFIICLIMVVTSFAEQNNDFKNASTRPLRILFVVNKFPVLAETTILNQITGLIDMGQDVSIFAFKRGNAPVVHSDVKKYKLMERTYFTRLPRNLRTYDIIYCQFGPMGNELVAIKERHKLKAKIVTCFRGYDISRFVQLNGDNVYDKLFEQGDLFLPVCNYFRKLLIQLGCPEHKIKVQHSAIDCTRFVYKKPNARSKLTNIITVARLTEKKGIAYAIEAVARLIKQHSQVRYTVVGDGVLVQPLLEQIRRLGVSHKISLVGSCTQNQVIAHLQRAHIAILPSVTADDGNEEGIPNAIKEAMAMGRPVIVTRHAGNGELVDDGVSGFLVPQRDVDALTERLLYLVKNRDVWERMGAAGRAKIEREFDVHVMNKRLLELFRGLVQN